MLRSRVRSTVTTLFKQVLNGPALRTLSTTTPLKERGFADVQLLGRVTRDPVFYRNREGNGMAFLNIAVNRYYQTKLGDENEMESEDDKQYYRKKTDYFDVIVFKDYLVTNVMDNVTKGTRILCHGGFRNRSRNVPSPNNDCPPVTVTQIQIILKDIYMLPSSKSDEESVQPSEPADEFE